MATHSEEDTHGHSEGEHHEEEHSGHGEEHSPVVDTGHSHDHGGTAGGEYDFWGEFLYLVTDPAHIAFEVFYTFVLDILIVFLIWGVIIKKWIIPKLRNDLHKQVDAEHGIVHSVDGGVEVHGEHSHPEPAKAVRKTRKKPSSSEGE